MVLNKVTSTDHFIWLCFSCWILIDSINGYAKTSGIGIPVSQIVKTCVFFLVVIRLLADDRIKALLVIVALYIAMLLVNTFGLGVSLTDAMTQAMKPITSFFFYIYFCKILYIDQSYFQRKFESVIILNFLFLLANVLLGLMGFGNSIYTLGDGDSYGIKGFIYAQNEISCVVAVLFPLILLYAYQCYSKFKYYLLCLFLLFIAFSIATKAAVFVAILSCLLVTYKIGSKREKKIIVLISVVALLLVVSYISYLMTSEFAMFQRFSYFYEKNGFAEAILSSRWTFWLERSPFFFGHDFVTQLFGLCNSEIICELDPFDALLFLGWIGFVINALLLVYLILVPCFRRNKNFYEKVMVISNSLIVFISLFSGHIFFSSMGGMFIALANSKLCQRQIAI